MKRIFQFFVWFVLALSVHARQRGEALPPSNLDPPAASQPQQQPPPNEPARKEQPPKHTLYDLVNPSDPKFYAKLGILIGSIILARKVFRQMTAS